MMATRTAVITPLTHDDIEGAVTCIQEAFVNDPYNNWVFDRSQFSFPRNRASLRTRCIWGIQNALFHVAKDPASNNPDQVIGVACWLPPSLAAPAPAPPTWSEWLWSWIKPAAWREWTAEQYGAWSLWTSQLLTNIRFGGRGGLNVGRYYLWKQAQASAQKELWDDPRGYYFCNIVTVLPSAQRQGVGKALMDVVLRTADREGRKCYLESSRNVPNVQIYEKMGFELDREMLCKEDANDEGITLYCMTRQPRQRY